MKTLKDSSFMLLAATLPALALAQDAAPVTEADSKNLFELIVAGGVMMIPLGICSLFMLFLIFYAWRLTSPSRFVPKSGTESLSSLLRMRAIAEAENAIGNGKSLLERALKRALTKAHPESPDCGKARIEAVIGDALEAEENLVAQWVNYLNVIAAVAPMIGLLGTVSGMIGAFDTISQGGMGRPELLAGDIGVALITTAAGLIIGIPAMIAYFILKNRLASQMITTLEAANDLVDDLTAAQ